jgi:hypothetical protein
MTKNPTKIFSPWLQVPNSKQVFVYYSSCEDSFLKSSPVMCREFLDLIFPGIPLNAQIQLEFSTKRISKSIRFTYDRPYIFFDWSKYGIDLSSSVDTFYALKALINDLVKERKSPVYLRVWYR